MNAENEIRKKLAEYGVKVEVEYAGENSPRWDENHLHDTWLFRFTKEENVAEILFYSSLFDTENGTSKENAPTLTDFFESVYPVTDDFPEFADEYGSGDCGEIYEMWQAVRNETDELLKVFTEEQWNELNEIAEEWE